MAPEKKNSDEMGVFGAEDHSGCSRGVDFIELNIYICITNDRYYEN
jgi:hypothetical protein